MTMTEFIEKHGLALKVKPTGENPNMDIEQPMNHWRCTITRKRRGRASSMTLTFSMGLGIKGEPTLDSILECLASDAAGHLNADGPRDWAMEYGYDPDSTKAHKLYKAVEKESIRLENFLGPDLRDELMYEVQS